MRACSAGLCGRWFTTLWLAVASKICGSQNGLL